MTPTTTPKPPPPVESIPPVGEWEKRLLARVRELRSARKRAIVEITEQGILLIYLLSPAGRVE